MNDNSQEVTLLKEKISEKTWYKNTEKKIKIQIDEIYDVGVLENLSIIEDEYKNREIIKIENITETSGLWIFQYKVRYNANNQTEVVESVIPKLVDSEMGKALILIKINNRIEMVILNGNLTALNIKYPTFSAAKTIFLPNKLEKWLIDNFNLKKVVVNKFIDLGKYRPYSELSIVQKSLFAIVLESEVNTELIKGDYYTLKTDNIDTFVNKRNDTATVLAISRLKADGVL